MANAFQTLVRGKIANFLNDNNQSVFMPVEIFGVMRNYRIGVTMQDVLTALDYLAVHNLVTVEGDGHKYVTYQSVKGGDEFPDIIYID